MKTKEEVLLALDNKIQKFKEKNPTLTAGLKAGGQTFQSAAAILPKAVASIPTGIVDLVTMAGAGLGNATGITKGAKGTDLMGKAFKGINDAYGIDENVRGLADTAGLVRSFKADKLLPKGTKMLTPAQIKAGLNLVKNSKVATKVDDVIQGGKKIADDVISKAKELVNKNKKVETTPVTKTEVIYKNNNDGLDLVDEAKKTLLEQQAYRELATKVADKAKEIPGHIWDGAKWIKSHPKTAVGLGVTGLGINAAMKDDKPEITDIMGDDVNKKTEEQKQTQTNKSEITDIMGDDEDKKIDFKLEQTKLSGGELPYKAFERDTGMRWTPTNVSKAAAHIQSLGFTPAGKKGTPEFNISLTNAIKQVREQDPEMYNEMVAQLSK